MMGIAPGAGEPGISSHPLHEDELLTVAIAAALAGRSLRTIRRAYRSGALVAYRDGNGRGVRIRYGDLRRWMMAAPVGAPARQDEDEARQLGSPLERLDMGGKVAAAEPSENLALLNAARLRLRRGGAGGGGGSSRSGVPAGASRV